MSRSMITVNQESINTNFFVLWFEPTGNSTRAYRFSSKRSSTAVLNHFEASTFREGKIIFAPLAQFLKKERIQ